MKKKCNVCTKETNAVAMKVFEKKAFTSSSLQKPDKKMFTNFKLPPTKNLICEMVRERHRRVGVIVGLREDESIKIGWAKCNVKLDKFDREKGLDMAEARARKILTSPKVPDCMRRQLNEFCARSIRYFKGARTLEIPV